MVRPPPSHKPRPRPIDQTPTAGSDPAAGPCLATAARAAAAYRQAFARLAAAKSQLISLSISAFA